MWQLCLYNIIFVLLVFLRTETLCNALANQSYGRILEESGTMFRTKQHRLISFDADGDITLDLDFNVPFITLPIKQSMETAKTSLINLNVGAVILGGAVMFGAAVAVPVILAFFNKRGFIPAQNPLNMLYSRIGSQRSEESYLWKYLNTIDKSLLDNDIDVTTCSQRLMCWAVRTSSENVAMGKGSNADKVFDGIISSEWFQSNVLNSIFNEAVKYGLKGENCSSIYRKCKLNHEALYYFLTFILDKFNSG